jgi:hypothetical protein
MESKPLPKENNLLRKLGLETILRQFVRSIATTVSRIFLAMGIAIRQE